jgi:CRISPR-associated endonuclease/helicase Cas3
MLVRGGRRGADASLLLARMVAATAAAWNTAMARVPVEAGAVNFTFWGKSARGPASNGPPYKPVLHHLLDVAAVAQTFLLSDLARLRREAALVGMAAEDYARLISFLAGLHDLGKFSRQFQWKVPGLWPSALGPRPAEPLAGLNHWRVTGLYLRRPSLAAQLRAYFPSIAPGYEAPLVAAIAGHHGAPPPANDTFEDAHDQRNGLDAACVAAAEEAFLRVAELTRPACAELLDEDSTPLLSWRLSGLITLADWVGSDADYFPLAPLEIALADYWRDAQEAAYRALAAKGLLPARPRSIRLHDIAPHAGPSPRPMQLAAESLDLSDGPQLILIEDATGSGKTEAAILLAARLTAAGRGEGLFVALPTMATANAMHKRLENAVDALFERGAGGDPSLILAHGKAALSRALANLSSVPLADGEPSTAATCNAWIADDRRRAFFADIGAVTIDQAFLSVLPKKHLTLRQYALAGRILIVDEAHCYDSYMKEELGALLRLHAMNGGSAIVLSATLSLAARREIAEGFLLGLSLESRDARRAAGSCKSLGYPLLSQVDASGVRETPVELARGAERTIDVVRLGSRVEAARAASRAADAGAAVLVICNAVDEAIAAHDALPSTRPGGTVHLFHARFAQVDRLAIEDEVLRRFGREAKQEDRAGHILVATQVVEQSLDLDFDLVISDLAPIDLLIQRAGRLWRHMDLRPSIARPTPGPTLMIVSPDPDNIDRADWLGACLGKAARVYQNAGIMWRSARVIFKAGRICIPDDLRPMIEAVYGDGAELVPQLLVAAEQKGVGKEGAAKTLGAMNVIALEDGYGLLRPVGVDEDIGTRLGEPTITLRLARRLDGKLVPWDCTPGAPLFVSWALSEVRVRRSFWGDSMPLAEDKALHDAARADWPEWEGGIELVEVEADGLLRMIGRRPLIYSPGRGLMKLPLQ